MIGIERAESKQCFLNNSSRRCPIRQLRICGKKVIIKSMVIKINKHNKKYSYYLFDFTKRNSFINCPNIEQKEG